MCVVAVIIMMMMKKKKKSGEKNIGQIITYLNVVNYDMNQRAEEQKSSKEPRFMATALHYRFGTKICIE